MRSKKELCSRDQDITPFTVILADLCEATGACCAVLVDREGETVDYGGRGDPFDIRVLAAEWRLVLQHAGNSPLAGPEMEMVVRASRKSFLVRALPEGYALVMQLPRRATRTSERALALARKRLCKEAGFEDTARGRTGDWTSVTVEEAAGRTKRPVRVTLEETSHEVTVLGLIRQDAVEREKSFRIRLSSGEERTLVREPFGHWYLEEDRW